MTSALERGCEAFGSMRWGRGCGKGPRGLGRCRRGWGSGGGRCIACGPKGCGTGYILSQSVDFNHATSPPAARKQQQVLQLKGEPYPSPQRQTRKLSKG